jgi:RNA polymerase sigma-70 factor, ECF subfamily
MATWEHLRSQLRPFIAKRVRNSSDVEDILQDVLIRMHRGLAQIREQENFRAWMYQIARTTVIDYVRWKEKTPLLATPFSEPSTENESDPIDDSESLDSQQNAYEMVGQSLALFVAYLPSPYREAITLTELEGRTHKEAADMLGISLTAMKSRVARGRTKLRAMLEECCQIALDARGKVLTCEPKASGKLPPNCCC